MGPIHLAKKAARTAIVCCLAMPFVAVVGVVLLISARSGDIQPR